MCGQWTTGSALRRRINALDPVRDDEEVTRLTSLVLYGDAYFVHSTFLVTFARQAAVPAIARMEQIHSNFLMDDELKAYTLATVVFEPERLAEQFGCSPFSDVEMQGRWNFWKGFAAAIFDALVEDWRRWYPDWIGGEKTARLSLTALLDDHLRETLELPKPSRAMALRVELTASAYLRSTPIRLMRRDRSVINYFGKRHADPRDLENVGFKPRSRGQRDKSAV